MNHLSTTRFLPRAAFLCLAALASSSVLVAQAVSSASPRYADIEIGSKGVKGLVLEMGPEGPTTVMKTVSNTTLAQGVAKSGVFSKGGIRDTAEEAAKFARRIRDEFQVPPEHVTVFGSSGLPKASNRAELVSAVADATSLPPMTFINPAEEVKYTIKGSLPDPADRDRGLVVDVGSGNTKGGVLTPSGVLDFSIPLGSVTYENKIAGEAKGKNQPFADTADQLRPTALEAEIARQIDAHPELKQRDVVNFSGGAAYAMVTLMKPEAIRQPRVEFTAGDIAEYAKLVRAQPLKAPSLDKITDRDTRAEAEKEVRNVFDTFTPTNLIAGSEILKALASRLDLEHKTLRFDRDSLFATGRGKLLELAGKDTQAGGGKKKEPHQVTKPPVYPSPQSPG